jgi:hypothetical protein
MFPVPNSTPRDASVFVAGSNSVEGFAAIAEAERTQRISKTLLQDLSTKDVFQLLVSGVPSIRIFESVWTFSGADLVSIDPKLFIRVLQTEFASFPFSVGVEVYKLVQQKIISDVSISEGQPSNLSMEVIQTWSDTPVPTFHQALNESSDVISRSFASNPVQFASNVSNQFQNVSNFSNPFQNVSNVSNPFQNVSNVSNSFQNVANVSNNALNFANQVQGTSNGSSQFRHASNLANCTKSNSECFKRFNSIAECSTFSKFYFKCHQFTDRSNSFERWFFHSTSGFLRSGCLYFISVRLRKDV